MTEQQKELARTNLGLAVRIASIHYQNNYDFPLSERVSAAQLALLDAVRRFDPDRGFQFSTYAWRVIVNALSKEFAWKLKHRAFTITDFGEEHEKAYEEEQIITIWDDLRFVTNADEYKLIERIVIDKTHLRALARETGCSHERIRQKKEAILDRLRIRMGIPTRYVDGNVRGKDDWLRDVEEALKNQEERLME